MNDYDRAIEIIRHDIAIGRTGPKQLERLAELLEQRGRAFVEEMALLKRFEEQPGPKPKPPILNPMNMNECLSPDGVWICDEWNGGRRPR